MKEQEKIGIIGGGKMGRSLFSHFIKYHTHVVWVNRSNHKKEQQRLDRQLKRQRRLELLTDEAYQLQQAHQQVSKSLNAISSCSFVIEAIDENITSKEHLFHQLEKIISPATLVVSNSSSIHPDSYTLSGHMASRFAGLHFFYPVESNRLAEVIPSKTSSEESRLRILDLCLYIDKQPLLQEKEQAFAVNRFFLELQSSLFNYCIRKDISFASADALIQKHLFPSGIFFMMEQITFPLLVKTIPHYMEYHPDPEQVYPLLSYLHKKAESEDTCFDTPCPSRKATISVTEEKSLITDFTQICKNIADDYIKRKMFTPDELSFVISELTDSESVGNFCVPTGRIA